MAKNLADLHHERGRLTERIATQRATLASQLAPVRNALQVSDRVTQLLRGGADYARQHPLALAAAGLALLLFKPRGSMRWARRGLFVWRTWRAVRQLTTVTLQEQLRRFRA